VHRAFRNADPAKAVIWGQQSWDEMMIGFFNLKFDAAMPGEGNIFAGSDTRSLI
jgi:hypothetical protein